MDDLTITSVWACVTAARWKYAVNGEGQIEISLGSAHQSVELIFDPLALRQLMEVAGSALEHAALGIIEADEEPAP